MLWQMSKLRIRSAEFIRREEGDVPGWVLITLMTAGLVIVIWGLAGPALSEIFGNAISKVTGL
ncbi:MAG: hypothetical protein ABIQ01_05355 [Pseudolysinimonas sp.]